MLTVGLAALRKRSHVTSENNVQWHVFKLHLKNVTHMNFRGIFISISPMRIFAQSARARVTQYLV